MLLTLQGDNANFTYSIDPNSNAAAMLNITTRQLGGDLYGVMTVRNSTLLDREREPQIIFTVSLFNILLNKLQVEINMHNT
jgi:hypothetical protein